MKEDFHAPAIVLLPVHKVRGEEASPGWTGNGDGKSRRTSGCRGGTWEEIYAWGGDGDHEDDQAQDW